MTDPTCRLLTLVGPGGAGKTRLALEVSNLQSHDFLSSISQSLNLPSPIYFTPLAPLTNASHLVAAIADVLGFTFYGRDNPKTQLLNYLRQKRLLIILDNFEHLLAEMPHLIHICQLVEGLPLGIELAAAWVRVLTSAEIASEIKNSLDFLAANLHDLPPRHRSLRAVFDHSWKLLDESERQALRQLAIFPGGCNWAAAAAVAAVSLSQLSALVDKSLLRQQQPSRYHIHDALRPYAVEKCQQQPEEETAVRTAHAHYYTHFLGERANDLRGGRQITALTEIQTDIENIRDAWQWAVATSDETAVSNALHSLALYYEMRGQFQQGQEQFSVGGERFEISQSPNLLHAQILARHGRFCHRLGQYDEAKTLLRESLAIAHQLEAAGDIAFALNNLGYVAWSQSDYGRAQSLFEESLALFERVGDKAGLAQVLTTLGDVIAARQWFEKALDTAVTLNSPPFIHDTLVSIANWHGRWGQVKKALEVLDYVLKETAVLAKTRGRAVALKGKLGEEGETAVVPSNQTLDQILQDLW